MLEATAPLVILVIGVVALGGFVKGLAGFGYAIVSTAILASVIDPVQAVVVMILPMLAADVSLVRELERDDLGPCLHRFWPFILAAAVGTAIGMALLGVVPGGPLRFVLGVVTVGYVVGRQPWAAVPGRSWVESRCFRPSATAKVALGFVSGVLFGATNIGVQIVAYLDSLDLPRGIFVGVLALVLVGISTLRVGLAWGLGLYAIGPVLWVSILAVVPGLVGVAIGQRVRWAIAERHLVAVVMVLLALIGFRLLVAGLLGI